MERRIVHLRDRLHRREPRENWRTFLEGIIEKAAEKYREEKVQSITFGK